MVDISNLSRGMEVHIRPGSEVRSHNPSKRKYITSRTQKVKIFNIYEWKSQIHARIPEISWAGAGGYWCHTNVDNIINTAD